MTLRKGEDARLKRTPEFYEKLMSAFREHGSAWGKVSDACKCDPKTARKAYEEGWKEYEWAPPIQLALEQEGVAVRARLSVDSMVDAMLQNPEVVERIREEIRREAYQHALKEMEAGRGGIEAGKEKAAVEAQKTRVEEANIAKSLRTRVSVLLGQTTPIISALQGVATKLKTRLEQIAKIDDADLEKKLDPIVTLNMLNRTADYLQKLALLAQSAVLIDRKAAGDPDFVLGLKQEEMSYDDAVKILQGAQTTFDRAKQFTVIQGGKED